MNDGSRASSALGGLALLATLVLLAGDAGAQAPRRPYRIGVLNEAWAANHPTVAPPGHCSPRRSRKRLVLPDAVLGMASMNSMTRGTL